MKKIVLLVFAVALGVVTKAQNKAFYDSFNKKDSSAVVQKMTELATLSGSKFVVLDRGLYFFGDTTVKDKEHRPKVIFKMYYDEPGANAELMIKGIPMYGLGTDIYGSFLGLFPIWKKYIDFDADIEKVSKETNISKYVQTDKGLEKIAYMDRSNGIWTLHILTNTGF